jgi:hypothetical protein
VFYSERASYSRANCKALVMTDNFIESEGYTPLSCAACQIIDRADGAEDGRVFTPAHYPVQHENQLLRRVLHAQDRAADKVMFVMVSQNRQAARSDLRATLDFENNVRSEIWSIHIGEKLGVDVVHVEEIVRQAIEAINSALTGP